jgi:hypothetical protein
MKILEKGKSHIRWVLCLGLLTVVIIYGMKAEGVTGPMTEPDANRPDVITIDAMKVFGNLERPAVIFLHDQHTEALSPKGQDCSACHLKETDTRGQERLSIKYKRLQDTNRSEVMSIYHNNCLQCHTEVASEGEKSGPLICGECHREKPEIISSGQPMGMDKSLHFRHVKAHENKCEQCHHEYDEKSKTLFYAKGREGTCRYCHMEETQDNRMSMRNASHTSCVDCHLKTKAKDMTSGPINCQGCHDLSAQEKIKVIEDIPRIERGQPDVLFIQRVQPDPFTDPELKKEISENLMNQVPFSHLSHENANDTCRVCHHAGMESCVTCHSVKGSKEGNFVRLETSMHQIDSQMSCMGCHETIKDDKNCAGCHAFMPAGLKKKDPSSCAGCHMEPLPDVLESWVAAAADPDEIIENGSVHKFDPLAEMALESRTPVTATYDEEDIPEKVIIKRLSKKYEPTELPHRKIVNTLMKNIQDSKITQYFHQDPGTLCQGCHHNSPVSKNPPSCESCHGAAFEGGYPYKPGLMAAYHNQCMGCHDQMGIEKPATNDCTGCHKEKKK